MIEINQWDILLAWLDPTHWNEQSWVRPVVVISWNSFNQSASLVIIVPLTKKIKNYFGNIILHPHPKNWLSESSEIMAGHVRSITKERIKKRIWSVTMKELQLIHYSLNLLLTSNT